MATATDSVALDPNYGQRQYGIGDSNFEDYSNADNDVQYSYNANGAMATDPYKGAQYTYDAQGRPLQVKVPAIDGTIDYAYSAAGEKLQATYHWRPGLSLEPLENTQIDRTGIPYATQTRHYAGNKIYENGVLKRILLPNGYIEDNIYYFYLRNHLGSTAVTAKADGTEI